MVIIERMTVKGVEIYPHIPPSGRSIPVEVTPFPIENSIMGETEISEAVNRLHLNCY